MADEQGLGHAFSMAALKAFFQEDKDIGKQGVLADLGTEVGLDRQSVLDILANGTFRGRHREALRQTQNEMAITSVPTIVVGRYVFRGVPSQEELRSAIDQITTEAVCEHRLPDTTILGDAY